MALPIDLGGSSAISRKKKPAAVGILHSVGLPGGIGGTPAIPGIPGAGAAPGAVDPTAPAATPPPVDYESLIQNDPIFRHLKDTLGAEDVSDSAGRAAAIRRALIQYGQVPDFSKLGLSPEQLSFLTGDVDPATGQLANQNTAEGTSLVARLNQAHSDNLTALNNALAARGMLSSGTTGYETGREDLNFKRGQSDATGNLLDTLVGYITNYLTGKRGRDAQLEGGYTDASGRQKDYLGDTAPGVATPPPVAGPAPVVGPPASPAAQTVISLLTGAANPKKKLAAQRILGVHGGLSD